MVNHQVDLPEGTTSRRKLIASLLAGGAVAATAPFLASQASAAGAPAAEMPTPPKRDAADNAGLNAALVRESRMAATYALAVAATSGDDKIALLHIHDHHVAYAQAIKGYLATEAGAAVWKVAPETPDAPRRTPRQDFGFSPGSRNRWGQGTGHCRCPWRDCL